MDIARGIDQNVYQTADGAESELILDDYVTAGNCNKPTANCKETKA